MYYNDLFKHISLCFMNCNLLYLLIFTNMSLLTNVSIETLLTTNLVELVVNSGADGVRIC